MSEELRDFLNKLLQLLFNKELNFKIEVNENAKIVLVNFPNDETNKHYLGKIIGRNKLNLKSIARVIQIWFKPKYPQYGLHLRIESLNERKE